MVKEIRNGVWGWVKIVDHAMVARSLWEREAEPEKGKETPYGGITYRPH